MHNLQILFKEKQLLAFKGKLTSKLPRLSTMSTTKMSLKPITVEPTNECHSSIIFLHGSGDTGDGVWWWLQSILGSRATFPHTRLIFPTAPVRPYTAMNGIPCSVWFDRKQISPFVVEDVSGIDASSDILDAIIDEQFGRGIDKKRIVMGGFSMGGSLAYYYTYRRGHDLAGVFALSSFLNENSIVYESVRRHGDSSSLPTCFQCHGDRDQLIPISWGVKTFETLNSLGVKGVFKSYENLYHQMNKSELEDWKKWTEELLSKIPN